MDGDSVSHPSEESCLAGTWALSAAHVAAASWGLCVHLRRHMLSSAAHPDHVAADDIAISPEGMYIRCSGPCMRSMSEALLAQQGSPTTSLHLVRSHHGDVHCHCIWKYFHSESRVCAKALQYLQLYMSSTAFLEVAQEDGHSCRLPCSYDCNICLRDPTLSCLHAGGIISLCMANVKWAWCTMGTTADVPDV